MDNTTAIPPLGISDHCLLQLTPTRTVQQWSQEAEKEPDGVLQDNCQRCFRRTLVMKLRASLNITGMKRVVEGNREPVNERNLFFLTDLTHKAQNIPTSTISYTPTPIHAFGTPLLVTPQDRSLATSLPEKQVPATSQAPDMQLPGPAAVC